MARLFTFFELQARIAFSPPPFLYLGCCEVLLFCRLVIVSLNFVPLSHRNMYGGPNKPIHNASFSATSTTCLLRAKLLKDFEE